MVSIHLKDLNAKADLTIDSQNGDIGITVVSEGKQLDFDMTFEEWELTTNFLKAQLNNQKKSNAVTQQTMNPTSQGNSHMGCKLACGFKSYK